MIRIHQIWSGEPTSAVDYLFAQFKDVEVTKTIPGTPREESEEGRSKANYVVYMVPLTGIVDKVLVDIVADIIQRPKRTVITLVRDSVDQIVPDSLVEIVNHLVTTFSHCDFLCCSSLQLLESFLQSHQPSTQEEIQS